MPRPRVTEIAQRQSPRGPPSLRTSSSDSDQLHPRPRTERTAKPSDGRSIRGAQSEPSNQKKLGTRIANLESQLGLAQEELKSLKTQLVSTDASKKSAHDQLDKKSKNQQKVADVAIEEKQSCPIENETLKNEDSSITYETSDDNNMQQETDVFEVPVEKLAVEPKAELELPAEEDELKPESPLFDELALKTDEINTLKKNLEDKDKELEDFRRENENLKSQLDEKSVKLTSAQAEIDELTLRFNNANQELEKSKSDYIETNEKLEFTEKAREELENEMRRLRIQSEQWRKAADAAASVLAGGTEINGRRLSERCGSMDKVYTNSFEHVSGYGGYVGSPGLADDSDDVFGSEKRKGSSGIRMLWKKKGQK